MDRRRLTNRVKRASKIIYIGNRMETRLQKVKYVPLG